MSKYFSGVLIILLITVPGLIAPVQARAQEMTVSAESAVLMDRESRRVLWGKDIHQSRPMASVTKIMTALLALELGDQSEMVVVTPGAARTEGSSIWLEEGERKTLEELVYGLMLCSGNDAAVAIAEHLAGTVENFAILMNCRARQLGALNTCFTNPHGLPDDDHYSTAYDLALISCQALGNQIFQNIVSTECRVITWPGNREGRYLQNQNRLLETFPGADGIKTGWTQKAGRCLAGSATRDNWQLVTVVLDAPQMWEDAAALLNYGYRTYAREKIFSAGQILAQAPVAGGNTAYILLTVDQDLQLPLLPGEKEKLQYKWKMADGYPSPICSGDNLGRVEVYLGGCCLGRLQLKAAHGVGKVSFWSRFRRLSGLLLGDDGGR